jgi:hypothetical protein
MNKDIFFLNNEPAAIRAEWDGKPVIDLGLENRCAWASAKSLVEALIHRQGEAGFAEMSLGQYKFPTLDIFLDEPSALRMPEIKKDEHGERYFFPDENMELGLFSALPPESPVRGGFLAASKNTGLVASVFRAYMATVETLAECKALGFSDDEMLWGWSSVLLAPLCDSLSRTLERQNAVKAGGSVISLWLRRDKDDDVKELVRKLSPRGELRLQNLSTGNTFILGAVDQGLCKKVFGIN